jgi:hypothetical protein
MLYVQLDTNWIHNPKIVRAGLDGAGLHAHCLCLAKSLDTDGWIDLLVLSRFGATGELIERLVDLGLLERDGERVRPNDWHERNPTKAALAAKQAAKVRAGKAGNHSRYGHSGTVEDCRICYPEGTQTPSVLAPAIAEARNGSQTTSTVHRSESVVSGAIAAAIDRVDPESYRLPGEQVAASLEGVAQVRAQTGFSRRSA